MASKLIPLVAAALFASTTALAEEASAAGPATPVRVGGYGRLDFGMRFCTAQCDADPSYGPALSGGLRLGWDDGLWLELGPRGRFYEVNPADFPRTTLHRVGWTSPFEESQLGIEVRGGLSFFREALSLGLGASGGWAHWSPDLPSFSFPSWAADQGLRCLCQVYDGGFVGAEVRADVREGPVQLSLGFEETVVVMPKLAPAWTSALLVGIGI